MTNGDSTISLLAKTHDKEYVKLSSNMYVFYLCVFFYFPVFLIYVFLVMMIEIWEIGMKIGAWKIENCAKLSYFMSKNVMK